MANGMFGGGNGTAANPYLVEDAADLNAVRNNLSACYKQVNDIDLSSWGNWTPIGGITNPIAFVGTYDGNGKKIKNLNISLIANRRYVTYHLGLFAYNKGTIQKVNLENINISLNTPDRVIVGTLCGYSEGLIVACCAINIKIDVYSGFHGGEGIGGLVGFIAGSTGISVINSFTTGIIDMHFTQNSSIGGIAGKNQGKIIDKCYSTVEIINVSSWSNVGGILGYGYDANVRRCFALNNKLHFVSSHGISYGRVIGAGFGAEQNYALQSMLIIIP